MNALLLPGNSPRHSVWIEDLKLALTSHFEAIVTQHYRHWETGDENANIDYEIGVAQQKAINLEPYMIVAKSIGTVIAVKGTTEGKLKPQKLILLGVPINGGVSKDLFFDWLKQVSAPVIFVQNTKDPLGSFSDVKSAFEGKEGNVTFIELPADTHDYLDFEAIAKLI